ncbi:hypothetical protein DSO57_1022976 [Entomophthora muscae]|uniref:Uncharacterized protein n=1 Tax=Entomophthora muscae TaxID=34485 RepID=A0ACC2TQH3_9FUNG|nr:hypothetical protein DSO57_1022976 [Entomophthora muscae]
MQFITVAIVTALAGASPIPQAAANKNGLGWAMAGKARQLRSGSRAADVKNVYANKNVLPLSLSEKSRKVRSGLRATRVRGAAKEKEGSLGKKQSLNESESSDSDSDSGDEPVNTPGNENGNAPGNEDVPVSENGNLNADGNGDEDDSDSEDDGGFDNVNLNTFGEDSEDSDDDDETFTNDNVEDNNNVNDANQGVLVEEEEDDDDSGSSSDEGDYYVKTDKEPSGKAYKSNSNYGDHSYKKTSHSGSGANDVDYIRSKGGRGYREKAYKNASGSKSLYRKGGDSDSDSDSDNSYPGYKRDLGYNDNPYSAVGGKSNSRGKVYYYYVNSKAGYSGTGDIKGTKGGRDYRSQTYNVIGVNKAFIPNVRARGDSYEKGLDSDHDKYSGYKAGPSDARQVYNGREKRVDPYNKGSGKGSKVNGESRSNAYSSGNKYDY